MQQETPNLLEADLKAIVHSNTAPQHVLVAARENQLPLVASRGLLTRSSAKIAKWSGHLRDVRTPERSDYHTICYNLAGAPARRIDKQSGSLVPGSFFIQPAHADGHFESDGVLDYYHFYISADLLSELAEEFGLPGDATFSVPEVFGLRDPGLSALADACLGSLMPGHPPTQIELDCWAQAFGAFLLRERLRISKWRGTAQSKRLTQRQLSKVKDYIEANLSGDLSLTALARVAEMPQGSFTRGFKESTDLSPFQFVVKRRIARAADLLAQREKTIAEIAYEVGFSSQSHMTDVFSKRLGIPPGMYRTKQSRQK